jgi:DNA polymerase-3 subunit delta'
MSKLIHPDVHFVFPVNKGPKSTDDKPTSESYLKYWRELAVSDPYFTEADLQHAIGIESKNGLIAVAEAKSIIGKLSLASVADGYKAVIFYLPEKMNQETANRLLKMVEEPPQKTLFLFITHAPEKVLQTIFSRCQSVRVMPLTKDEAARVEALKPARDMEEQNVFMDLFSDMLRSIVSRDLTGTLECGEAMAALESREKQKAFCTFAGNCVRKIFMLQQKLPQISDVDESESDFYEEMASKCPKGFCVKTMTNIEKVVSMIDRNVNSKILFCDLVNRMFLNI